MKSREVWETAPFEMQDVHALRALDRGEATPDQQRRALYWWLHRAARVNAMSFQPESARASDFAEGRRFPGLQTKRMLTADMQMLKAQAEKFAKQGDDR